MGAIKGDMAHVKPYLISVSVSFLFSFPLDSPLLGGAGLFISVMCVVGIQLLRGESRTWKTIKGMYWGYIGIMEKKRKLLFRV